MQQSDPLGSLLFSLVLMQFIGFVRLHNLVSLHIWYLDNGNFISSKSSLLKLLDSFSVYGLQFCLHLNLSKCELFWPSGDSFPEFLLASTELVKVWSSYDPLFGGTDNFFDQFLSSCLSKVVATQDSIAILEDPQVELHL